MTALGVAVTGGPASRVTPKSGGIANGVGVEMAVGTGPGVRVMPRSGGIAGGVAVAVSAPIMSAINKVFI